MTAGEKQQQKGIKDSNLAHLFVVLKRHNGSDGIKWPVKAVSGHKIAANRFKTTYRSVLTFEEKKQSDRNSLLLTCLKLFQASTWL